MKNILRALTFTLFSGAICTLAAAPVCPSTPNTSSDCDYLITISSAGTASVSNVPGSTPFNSMVTFNDGTSDPGADGSLVGVINNYVRPLSSFTLLGSGASAGIFDFSFNGICVYTNAPYCGTAQSGYEGPTTTFSDLRSTVLFHTTEGIVTFNPTLMANSSTYFSIEDSAADINAKGGLSVSNLSFASAAAPEPVSFALLPLGVSALYLFRRRLNTGA